MKIIVIPDIHGRSSWKLIVNSNTYDLVVFLGDYFDSFEFSGEEQIKNFLDILEFKKSNPDKVVLLIGNHDHHYFPGIGNTGTSGFQELYCPTISYILGENKSLLQMAYKYDKYLFTHAGVTPTWLDHCLGEGEWKLETIDEYINDLWNYKPFSFCFMSYGNRTDDTGDNIWQSPIWVRPRSLMKDAYDFKKDIIQIVGHTIMKKIDIHGKSTGGRYYFIDTLGTSGEYLIIEDGKIYSQSVY